MEKERRGVRKRRVGVVVSNKMNKTVVVQVERSYLHPKYHTVVVSRKRLKAHDENNECRIGDKVRIQETRPLSKTKCWRVLEIIEKAD
jgi:small subunit ribosomal protein S17